MLLPTVMFLDELMDKFSAKMLMFVILSLLTILALGSRGPILCTVVFGLLKFISPNLKRPFKRVLWQLSILSIGFVIIFFLEKIMLVLYNFLLKFDINSRSLILFSRDEVYLSGRDRIYETIIKEIIDSPILGIGIAGDRPLFISGYVHNVFFEILANFGVVIGSLISILLLTRLVQSLKSKDIEKYNIVIIWISLGFVHLLFSSSYLIDIRFWILIGVIVNILKKKRYNQIFNKESILRNKLSE
jgi:O-antigen ligase